MRIGHGYDVHRLVEGRPLIIGGVTIPFEKGLLGHSDADVLCHAIGDALLGAAGLGDLGQHFPDSDARYKDISSLEILKMIQNKLSAHELSLANLDATIICQQPRLSEYLPTMKENISQALEVTLGSINIKATTEEGMGFTGQEDGMAAQAIVLLKS
jgi:2-C-methyl-D-erythritol 2,4-cyclodiphosphate synthase